MNEQQPQPQYFDVTPEAPAPRAWWKTWKLVLPVAVLGVVVLVVIFLVNALGVGGDSQEQEDALTRMEQDLAACDEDRDPASCKDRVRNDAARSGGGEDACEGLEGDAYGSCVTLSAKSSADIDACASLDGDDRTSCEDLVYFALGQEEGDVEICEKIVDMRLRASCTLQVIEDAVAANDCGAAHVDEAFCVAAEAMRSAIATGDPADCAALASDADRDECADGQLSVDNDNDGLPVREEFMTGTSDNNADTDGDGYTDGEEVAAGYDPLH